ncbi:MAG: hypothetical protein VW709_05885 [Rickettsiales bacterium]
MPINRFPLFFFNRWQHAVAQEILEGSDAVEIRFLKTDMDETETWPAIETGLGYQIGSARDELPTQYHVSADFLARAPKLLAVCTHGAGYDTVDVDACTGAGVLVCNQAGENREAVAEHALGMMLTLGKRIFEADRRMRSDRDWDRNLKHAFSRYDRDESGHIDRREFKRGLEKLGFELAGRRRQRRRCRRRQR